MNKLLCILLAMMPLTVAGQYQSRVWCADKGNGTYVNPVINADYSDPDVVAVGDDYYLTSSSFNCVPGLPILHSRDLVNWEIVGHALERVWPDSLFGGLPAHGKGVWAPCICYHNGSYRIYWGDPDQGVFMVKAQRPEGPWEPPRLILPGKGIIDTSPLWDDDGLVTVTPLAHLAKTGQDDNDYQFAIYEEVFLQMKVDGGIVRFAFSRDGKHFKDVGEPFKMREGKWIGAKMGFVAQEPNVKSNRGWIDIDWFNVTD